MKEKIIMNHQEYEIDYLLNKFQQSLSEVSENSQKSGEMLGILKEFNPKYQPVPQNGSTSKEHVMEQIVAGVYAPLIHAYTKTIVSNIACGNLPDVVVAPPRDAIPLVVSLKQMSKMMRVEVKILTPPLNRNTAGIKNNQTSLQASMDPLFPQMLSQVVASAKGGLMEVETGIYGTTSLSMGKHMKQAGLDVFVPTKFYGLGPNISFVHAVLSEGESWIAEEAESSGLVDVGLIKKLMVFVDSLEEFGMQNFYHSVQDLQLLSSGKIAPVIIKQAQDIWSLAYASNMAIKNSAKDYLDISLEETKVMLEKIPWLVEQSKKGFPFTLESEIPPMDSKEEHYASIRKADVFDYPVNLKI